MKSAAASRKCDESSRDGGPGDHGIGEAIPILAGAVMVSVVVAGPAPGVTEEWLKLPVMPAERPETLKVTGLAKPPALLGATVMVMVADLPWVSVVPSVEAMTKRSIDSSEWNVPRVPSAHALLMVFGW